MDSNSGTASKININEFSGIGSHLSKVTMKQDIKKCFKLKLILEILKQFCEEGGDSSSSDANSNERAVKSTKTFIANNFLQNIGIPDYIQVTRNIHLSYTEQQLINGYLVSQIEKSFRDSIDIIRKIKSENHEYLNSSIIPEKVLIDLEMNRQQLYKDLVLIKQKKYKLLLDLIDVRLSPQIENEMRILLKELEILDVKAETIYCFTYQHAIQTEFAVNAFKNIEAIVDKKLEEKLQLHG